MWGGSLDTAATAAFSLRIWGTVPCFISLPPLPYSLPPVSISLAPLCSMSVKKIAWGLDIHPRVSDSVGPG